VEGSRRLEVTSEAVTLVDFKVLTKNFPQTATYLLENKKRLENREKGKMKGAQWYGYIYLKNMRKQSLEKLCVPRLVESLFAAHDSQGNHFLDNVDVGGVTWKAEYQEQNLTYLLALLNSKLLRWFFPFVSAPFRGGWLSANRQFLSQLPVRVINISDKADKVRVDKIVALVAKMIATKPKCNAARSDKDRTYYENMCAALDRQIDAMVYELYGLTNEEIAIIEAD
jgi:hypothetical protein